MSFLLALEIGKRIREFREFHDLTQGELALKTGLTPAAISMIEAGRRAPTAPTLIKLSDALFVTTDRILKGERRR